VQALEKAMLETEEARSTVSAAAAAFDIDPSELNKVEDRLFTLRAASRKYGVDIAALMAKRLAFATELEDIDNVESLVKAARKASDKAEVDYVTAAQKLRGLRIKAARAIEKSVLSELPPLKMERAQFEAALSDAAPSSAGIDKVRFNVAN